MEPILDGLPLGSAEYRAVLSFHEIEIEVKERRGRRAFLRVQFVMKEIAKALRPWTVYIDERVRILGAG